MSKDNTEPVTSEMIAEWVLVAVNEVDPIAADISAKIAKLRNDLAEVEKKIKGVPKLILNDAQGKPLPQEEADSERQVLYDMYGQAKFKLEQQIERRNDELKAQVQKRKDDGLICEVVSSDANTNTAVWRIGFDNYEDAVFIENALTLKDDWQSIRLAAALPNNNPPLGPWAGRGAIPDGSKEYLPDYTQGIVNMGAVLIKRLAHGVGSFKELDRQSSNYAADRFGYYTGQYDMGKKHGEGIEIDDCGVYAGQFESGYRIGRGRLDMANGLTATGTFGSAEQFPSRKGGYFFENPYVGGDLISNDAEILFPGT
jgi:hypothetical protein